MKYIIYSRSSQEWFCAPGRGLTANEAEAHRFTRAEAEREMALYYNEPCELHPVGEPETHARSGE